MYDLLVVLIPVFPLLAVLANGIFGNRYSPALAARLAVGSVGLSFLCATAILFQTISNPDPREVVVYSWIFGGDLSIDLAFLIDPLSAVMLMVVTVVVGRVPQP